MSLGYARDSIADLQSLHNIEKEELDTNTAPSSTYLRGVQHPQHTDCYDYNLNDALFLEEEEACQEINVSNAFVSQTIGSDNHTSLNVTRNHHEKVHPNTVYSSSMLLEERTEVLNDDQSSAAGRTDLSLFPNKQNKASLMSSSKGYVNRPTKDLVSKTQVAIYSGFDYSDYYQELDSNGFMTGSSRKKKNILCCLFPFLQDPLLSDDDESTDDTEPVDPIIHHPLQEGQTVSREDDKHEDERIRENGDMGVVSDVTHSPSIAVRQEFSMDGLSVSPSASSWETDLSTCSSGDDACESHSPAMPEVAAGPMSIPVQNHEERDSSTEKHDIREVQPVLENEEEPKTPTLKGILKHTVIKPPLPAKSERYTSSVNNATARSSLDKNPSNTKRRSILPTYESSVTHKSPTLDNASERTRSTKSVSFSSMARVVPVLPRSEMSYFLKSMIWWQRTDYEDFKKAGRIISKAMLQGGSEIWLQTSDAWGKKRDNRTEPDSASNHVTSEEYRLALGHYGVKDQGEEKLVDSADDDVGHKWWCKFGHSRRGLEHIVSVDEGRQRQKLVNASITAVLEEQRRQRISRKDPNKIAAISMQYTSWAKDLARAAGEADAEAVRSNFHSRAKGRLSYLSSRLLNRKDGEKIEGQPCASFILSANPALMAEVLDSHAHDGCSGIIRNTTDGKIGATRHSEYKDDIAHKAAGFQFQQAAPA